MFGVLGPQNTKPQKIISPNKINKNIFTDKYILDTGNILENIYF